MNVVRHNDLLCVSHVRWDDIYQRPHYLMSCAAKTRRVFFIEEPRLEDKGTTRLEIRCEERGVLVVVPFLPAGLTEEASHEMFAQLLDQMFSDHSIVDYTLWFYSAMPLPAFLDLSARGHQPQSVVYDCVDEPAHCSFALPELGVREAQLFGWADVVFTEGQSLYEAKGRHHDNAHAFPSSVDVDHFAKATLHPDEPKDLQDIPHPRIGFVGVIDERIDNLLLRQVAQVRPEWQFVMIGPVVNLSAGLLPQADNLHYLGQKVYKELPSYLAHFDVAMIPFTLDDATRFISPSKTPEYLAAGKSVISTSIRDVVCPYGEKDLVVIADDCHSFIAGIEHLLNDDQTHRRSRADAFVNRLSWDQTWQDMERCLAKCVSAKKPVTHAYLPQHLKPLPATASLGRKAVAPSSVPSRAGKPVR